MRNFIFCLISPHSSNNHRAHMLHHKTLFFVIGILIFSSFFFSSSFNPFSQQIKAFADVSLQELVNLTNQKRAENGLFPLTINEQLNDAANKKLNDMFEKDYWAHNSPEGTTPWYFIKNAGYDYVYAGENLARGFSNSEDVVNAWMASTYHRENVLSPNYNEVGFAVKSGVLGGEETILVVEEFGSKNILPAATSIENTESSGKISDKILSLINGYKFSASQLSIIILLTLFIGVFILDILIMNRKKVYRFVGHSMDHVIFLSGIVIVILLFGKGFIL